MHKTLIAALVAAIFLPACETLPNSEPQGSTAKYAADNYRNVDCADQAEYDAQINRARTLYEALPKPHISQPFSAGLNKKAPARPVKIVPPNYPLRMQEFAIEGVCAIVFSVSPEGKAEDITPSCSDPAFENQAIRAIQKYEFEPAIMDGNSVWTTHVMQPVRFCLEP